MGQALASTVPGVAAPLICGLWILRCFQLDILSAGWSVSFIYVERVNYGYPVLEACKQAESKGSLGDLRVVDGDIKPIHVPLAHVLTDGQGAATFRPSTENNRQKSRVLPYDVNLSSDLALSDFRPELIKKPNGTKGTFNTGLRLSQIHPMMKTERPVHTKAGTHIQSSTSQHHGQPGGNKYQEGHNRSYCSWFTNNALCRWQRHFHSVHAEAKMDDSRDS